MQRESGESPAQHSTRFTFQPPPVPPVRSSAPRWWIYPAQIWGCFNPLGRRRVGGANGRLAWMVLEHRGGMRSNT
jgi:hypothetical protein